MDQANAYGGISHVVPAPLAQPGLGLVVRSRFGSNWPESVSFYVPGTPVGKGRPKFARRGKVVTAYTPEKTASYENLVKTIAYEAMRGRPLFECAVGVWISLSILPPASWSAKKRSAALAGSIFPTTKPDIDNTQKCILDACNGIVFVDDKQACDGVVTKRYAAEVGAMVIVTPLIPK